MQNTSFGLVGAGWRAEFFLRIARDWPEQFPFAGIVVRDTEKAESIAAKWRVPVYSSVDDLLEKGQPQFVITSVPWVANLPLMAMLAERKIPVLSETPIAPKLEEMHQAYALVQQGARIQVAEQYLFQPMHAARLNLIRSGKLGRIHEVTVSIAHGYHGLSLVRKYLGIDLELPEVSGFRFRSPLVSGPGRNGPPAEETIKESERVIARLDFGDRMGIYDFTGDQYFSWVRGPQLVVRGDHGELNWNTARYLRDYRTPLQLELLRRNTGHDGNLEGYSLESIQAGGDILYSNPFPGARWSDDEIAVATSLEKMQKYAAGGEEFYSVKEACQDRYLDLLVEEAVGSGRAIRAERQPWC